MDRATAHAVAASLDLRIDPLAPCPLCLLNVAWALREGDERKVASAIRFHAPILWDEGLEEPTKEALERARKAGVAGAEEAIADVEARGARAGVVHALVRVRACGMLDELERDYIASLN